MIWCVPFLATALETEAVKNAIVATLNAVGEEVTHFKTDLEALAAIPSDDMFGTTTAAIITSVVHTPSDDAGSNGTIVYTFNAENPLISSSTLTFTYASNSGVPVNPITCSYAVSTAPLDIEAVHLHPDGVTTTNLFPKSSYAVIHGCVSPKT